MIKIKHFKTYIIEKNVSGQVCSIERQGSGGDNLVSAALKAVYLNS